MRWGKRPPPDWGVGTGGQPPGGSAGGGGGGGGGGHPPPPPGPLGGREEFFQADWRLVTWCQPPRRSAVRSRMAWRMRTRSSPLYSCEAWKYLFRSAEMSGFSRSPIVGAVRTAPPAMSWRWRTMWLNCEAAWYFAAFVYSSFG